MASTSIFHQRRVLGGWALYAGIFAALIAVLVVLGLRQEVIPQRIGLQYGLGAVIVVSLLTVILALLALFRGSKVTSAILALLLAGAVLFEPARQLVLARSVPPIHDITTDTDNPPPFVAIAPMRKDAPNPVEYSGVAAAAMQKAAYPDIKPLSLALAPTSAYEKALAAAKAMEGWQIVEADAASGRIEATATTFWLGFKDDIVIRVSSETDGARIDMRSKSRVGRSDVGKNAARIRAYFEKLKSL